MNMAEIARLQPEKGPKVAKNMRFRLAGLLLGQLVNEARLVVRCKNDGPVLTFGKVGQQPFTMFIDQPATLWEILRDPDPGLGDTYMDGRWEMAEGDIGAFVSMLARGRQKLFEGPTGKIFTMLLNSRPDDYDHSPEASYGQVQHHYDIGNGLYKLFLDEGMNYSCAFFETSQQSLRDAQLNKIETTIKRLDIKPGMKVLDIGCGWGETSRVIAREADADVSGVTLAKNQLAIAKDQAKYMKNLPQYFLQDYREHATEHESFYDRIVSIGMFEHVGDKNYGEYFKAVFDQLKPGGKALIHSIVRSGKPSTAELSSPWLDKYIFPGGCLCEVEDMVREGEQQGLKLAYEPYIQESFHYAETLRRWRENFVGNLDKLDSKKYDERFIRMWIFYFAMCEAMFDGCGYRVAQVVFEKPS
ncbi:MAG: cyclopropane-fatty-acyl-phospholipid synthase [Micavibrio sp.]|nr:MAG: cyclopropane-fatty-acyl-phospholipid synthase [Micavibrio sp.]